MTLSIRLFAAFFLATLLVNVAAAQESNQASAVVPRLVNYSGHAIDAHGKSITGIAGVTFAIYRDQEGGSPLWLETQNITADTRGNYTVQLGSTKGEGLPVDLFNTKESRWLGVRVSGQEEQPRVLLLSVPYALKAADAETLGGLPASAFMLAAPTPTGGAKSASDNSIADLSTGSALPPPLSGSGTTDFVPLWTSNSAIGSSVLFQSGTGSSAKVGINTTTPTATLDVKGTATLHGPLTMPAINTANSSSGSNSQPQTLVASVFNSTTNTAVNQKFRWQAEAVGNNTSSAGGSLNLLYAPGSGNPAETGLKIGGNGRITFASGQTFPGTGSVSSVGLTAPNSDFNVSSSPVTGNGTLALNWNVVPTSLNSANAIVKRDNTGSFNATAVGVNTLQANSNGLSIVAISTGEQDKTVALSGTSTAAGNGEITYGVAGSSGSGRGAGVFGVSQNGSSGNGVFGEANNNSGAVEGENFNPAGGAGVIGVGAWGFYTDNNVHQGINGGGWVKAMIVYDDVVQGRMLRCFNSNLAGTAATTVPCGFSTNFFSTGVYGVNFGFEVDNRFLTANASANGGHYFVAGVSPNGSSSVIVNVFDVNSLSLQDGIFTVIVY